MQASSCRAAPTPARPSSCLSQNLSCKLGNILLVLGPNPLDLCSSLIVDVRCFFFCLLFAFVCYDGMQLISGSEVEEHPKGYSLFLRRSFWMEGEVASLAVR